MNKILLFLLVIFTGLSAFAQGEHGAPGLMRSHLKLYVVVAVLLIIFSGITIFLFSLERRLKKLETDKH